ncbi:MAG: hypothetical protein COA84_07685 [Robiginitomaculum sp.]|nr:MAG: hypothetical protein COA84_07685 [Robiginitomaculum sp.]
MKMSQIAFAQARYDRVSELHQVEVHLHTGGAQLIDGLDYAARLARRARLCGCHEASVSLLGAIDHCLQLNEQLKRRVV